MEIPGLKVSHQMITPTCQSNRGTTAAFLVAAERVRNTYDDLARDPANTNVTWHLVLMRQEPK